MPGGLLQLRLGYGILPYACYLLLAFYYHGHKIAILRRHANALGHSDWRWQEVIRQQTVCVHMCTFGMCSRYEQPGRLSHSMLELSQHVLTYTLDDDDDSAMDVEDLRLRLSAKLY